MGADKKTKYADVIIDISHEALDRVFQYRVPFPYGIRWRQAHALQYPSAGGTGKEKVMLLP